MSGVSLVGLSLCRPLLAAGKPTKAPASKSPAAAKTEDKKPAAKKQTSSPKIDAEGVAELMDRGQLELRQKHYKQAAALFVRAAEAYRQLDQPAGRAKALFNQGVCLLRMKSYPTAAKTFSSAAASYKSAGDPLNVAWMLGWKADALAGAGDRKAAAQAYTESVGEFSKLKATGLPGLALNSSRLGAMLKQLNRPGEAAKAYAQSAETYKRLKRPSQSAQAEFDRAVTLYRAKKYESAAEGFDRAANAYQEAKDVANIAWMYGWKGDALRNGKKDKAAVAAYSESARRFRDLKDKGLKGLSRNSSSLGKALKRLRRYDEAIQAFQQAADAYERLKQPSDAAWMYSWKGDCHRDSKDDSKAVDAYAESVRRFVKLKQSALPRLALTAKDLGKALRRLKQYDRAAKAHGQSAEAYRQLKLSAKAAEVLFFQGEALLRGKHYQQAAVTFITAARTYEHSGDSLHAARMYGWAGDSLSSGHDDRTAVKAYAESVRRFAALKDKGIAGLSVNASSFGKSLTRLRRYDEAIKAFQQAADAYEHLKQQSNSAWMYGRMGNCHRDAGDGAAAVKAYAESARRFAALKKTGLLGLSANAREMGKVLKTLKRYDEAVRAFQQSAVASDRRNDAIGAAYMYGWQGDCYRESKNDQAAVKAYTECVRRFEGLKKKGLEGLALNTAKLAGVYQNVAKFADAKKWFQRSAEAYEKLMQPVKVTDARLAVKHVELLAKLSPAERKQLAGTRDIYQKARALYKQNKYRAVEPLYQEILEIRRKLLGENHRLTATAYGNLGLLHARMAEFSEAERLFKKAIEIDRKVLGEQHPDFVIDLNSLASLYRDMGAYAKAEPLYKQALTIRRKILGRSHLDTSSSLNSLASLYRKMARYSEAEPLYREALEIRKRSLGLYHTLTAVSLNNLGLLYADRGDYAKAEPLYKLSMEIDRRILGEQNPGFATDLNNLASLYSDMARYTDAEKLYRQALDLRLKVLGPDHLDTATSLSNLGFLYHTMGAYSKAEPLYKQALAIRRKSLGEDHRLVAICLNNLGLLYKDLGDYPKAESLYRKSAAIDKKVLGEHHPSYAIDLNNLAGLYMDMNDYTKAEPLYVQALEIKKKAFGPNHPSVASGMNNLGLLYKQMGKLSKASVLYKQALEIKRKILGSNHPSIAVSLANLGGLYSSMGNYEQAESLYRQALEIDKTTIGPLHPNYIVDLNNLGYLYSKLGNFAKAEPLYRQALEIRLKVLGPNHPDTAASLNNLAWLYRAMGNYAKAEPLYRKALLVSRSFLEHTALAQSERQQLAMGQMLRHRLDAYISLAVRKGDMSQRAFEQVLLWKGATLVRQKRYRKIADEPTVSPLFTKLQQVTTRLASLARAFPKKKDEVASWKDQITALTAEKEKLESELSRQSAAFRKTKRQVTPADVSAALPKNAVLVDFLEFWRSRQINLIRRGGLGVALTKTAGGFSIGRIISGGAAAKDGRLKQGDRILTISDAKNRQISTKGKSLKQVLGMMIGTPYTKVRVRVGRKGVTSPLEFEIARAVLPYQRRFRWNSVKSLMVSVLHPNGQVTLIDLGPTKPIAKAIETWRKTFGLSRQGLAAGQELRKALWEPLLTAIGGAKTVLISPDGVVGRLPFGALPGKKPGTYLLEELRLALIPVPQLLPALINEKGRKQVEKGLLLMGDVDYDASPGATGSPRGVSRKSWRRRPTVTVAHVRGGTTFHPLSATAGEIASLEVLFRQVFQATAEDITALRRGSATEARFRQLAPHYYHIHLATHGFFAPPEKSSALAGRNAAVEGSIYDRSASDVRGFDPGLLSGLAFAGANLPPRAGRDDGILTAEEIAFLPLDGVELVTLSACQSGLGRSAGGEGLLGVQRAFQVSGARTTVASYWKVDDLATRRLMERFYRNLWEKKMPRIDALREAQLWLLKHPDQLRGLLRVDNDQTPRQSPPYYWAAFQLSGDWR